MPIQGLNDGLYMRLVAAKTVDEVLAKYVEAEKINPPCERVMDFSWDDLVKLKNEIECLRAAIRKTIDDNLYLAGGEICTLIDLKKAINYDV